MTTPIRRGLHGRSFTGRDLIPLSHIRVRLMPNGETTVPLTGQMKRFCQTGSVPAFQALSSAWPAGPVFPPLSNAPGAFSEGDISLRRTEKEPDDLSPPLRPAAAVVAFLHRRPF